MDYDTFLHWDMTTLEVIFILYARDTGAYLSYCWRILEMIYTEAWPYFPWMMDLETFMYRSIVTFESTLITDAIVLFITGA